MCSIFLKYLPQPDLDRHIRVPGAHVFQVPNPASELRGSRRLKRATVVEKRGVEVAGGCREEKKNLSKPQQKPREQNLNLDLERSMGAT